MGVEEARRMRVITGETDHGLAALAGFDLGDGDALTLALRGHGAPPTHTVPQSVKERLGVGNIPAASLARPQGRPWGLVIGHLWRPLAIHPRQEKGPPPKPRNRRRSTANNPRE